MTTPALSSEKLSPLTKLAFGAGDLGPAIVSGINGFFLNAFLLDVAGLRPAVAGTIFLIVKIWDAVNDPLMGTLTDRTVTRWGRRRPWLLFATIPFGPLNTGSAVEWSFSPDRLRELDRLAEDLAVIEKELARFALKDPDCQRLLTVAGINMTVAVGIKSRG